MGQCQLAALKSLPPGMLLLLPYWTIVRYLVQARVVLRSQGAGAQFRGSSSTALAAALLRGMRDAARALPQLLRKRSTVMKSRRLSPAKMRQLLATYSISFMELLDAG